MTGWALCGLVFLVLAALAYPALGWLAGRDQTTDSAHSSTEGTDL